MHDTLECIKLQLPFNHVAKPPSPLMLPKLARQLLHIRIHPTLPPHHTPLPYHPHLPKPLPLLLPALLYNLLYKSHIMRCYHHSALVTLYRLHKSLNRCNIQMVCRLVQ